MSLALPRLTRSSLALPHLRRDHQYHNKSEPHLECTNIKSNGKKCTLCFCKRCASGRYGEDPAKVIAAGGASSWKCPACRGECE